MKSDQLLLIAEKANPLAAAAIRRQIPQVPAAGRKPRARGTTGRTLEDAVARGGGVVELSKIPNGMRFVGGGKTIFQRTPCDFAGTVVGTGRAVWIDAKQSHKPGSFDASDDKVKPHQAAELVRHGRAGAVAGLIVESTKHQRYYWLDWRLLVERQPTYPWAELADVGPATHAVDWAAVLRASDLAAAKGGPQA